MILRVRIEGMQSTWCVQAVFTALTPVAGIRRADVQIGSAEIEHDGSVSVEAVREAIAVVGYSVSEAVEDRRTLPML